MPQELQGHANPTLAFNMNVVSDFSTQMPFLDIMKMSRPFEIWGDGAMSNDGLLQGGYLDENGYPSEIPDGAEQVTTIWDWTDSTNNNDGVEDSRAGTYVMRWEGEGELELGGGINIISQEDGEIVFENPGGDTFWMNILSTDPDGEGDNIRDISIVREEHVELHEAGGIFNPDWIDLIDDTRQVRFMDWMETNNSEVSETSDLSTMDSASWVGEGQVPVEAMVDLANQIGADPWFTIPLDASEDYVTDFATYVRDNLDEGLQATFELSNETWNYMFEQTQDLADQAEEDWGNTYFGNPDIYSAYGREAVEMAHVLENVYGEDNDAYTTTLGVPSWEAGEEMIRVLTAPSWEEADPEGYVPPYAMFDSVSATTYFGGNIMADDELRAEFMEQLAVSPEAATEWLNSRLSDPDFEGSVPDVLSNLESINALADQYGLDLTIYEGGQHLHHAFGISGEAQQASDFLSDYVNSEDMAGLYQQLWDGWAEIGDGPQMQFGDVAGSSIYGTWGLSSGLDDDNPRAQLLHQLNADSEATWEDRGGEHFQQGVYETGTDGSDTIEGTNAEDFLIGGGGDDVLNGAGDNDGLHGGDGMDTAVYGGDASDYGYEVAEQNGVTGVYLTDLRDGSPDGTDWLVDIEQVQFADGTISLADLISGDVLPDEDAPVDDTPADDVPVDDTPADDVPVDDTPTDDAPVDDTPTDDAPVDDTPADDAPVDDMPADDAPVDDMPADDAPVDDTPVDDAPKPPVIDLTLDGSNGSDWLEVEELDASASTSVLNGFAGSDHLYGGAGRDLLNGGADNDFIFGGIGADTLTGGAGDDFLFGTLDDGPQDSSEDTAKFSGSATEYAFSAHEYEGHTILTVDGPDGRDTLTGIEALSFDDATASVSDVVALLEVGEDLSAAFSWGDDAAVDDKPVDDGGDDAPGDDTDPDHVDDETPADGDTPVDDGEPIDDAPTPEPEPLDPDAPHNDALSADFQEWMAEMTGDDLVLCNEADNVYYGGAGNDTMQGEEGNDTLYAGEDALNDDETHDVASFMGNIGDYTISKVELTDADIEGLFLIRVEDADDGGADGYDEGTDDLYGFDELVFADGILDIDLIG